MADNGLSEQYNSLLEQIIKDCSAPGEYVINLTIPHYPNEPMGVTIAKIEPIREVRYSKNRVRRGRGDK